MEFKITKKMFCVFLIVILLTPAISILDIPKNQGESLQSELVSEYPTQRLSDDRYNPWQGNEIYDKIKTNDTLHEQWNLNQTNKKDVFNQHLGQIFDTLNTERKIIEQPFFRNKNIKISPENLIKLDIIEDLVVRETKNALLRMCKTCFPFNPHQNSILGQDSSTTGITRASRATGDLVLSNVRWEEKNSGWCEVTDATSADNPEDPVSWYQGNQASTGSFFVGEETEIIVSVTNEGDSIAQDIFLNLSIYNSIHDNQPMKRNPSTEIIDIIYPGQTKEVIFYWTPPYASTSVSIYSFIDWSEDSNQNNNALIWNGIKVCKWLDDLDPAESGWKHYAREDIQRGSVDDWHLTTSAHQQMSGTHTHPNSWYEGYLDQVGSMADRYRNNNASSLESPLIDLGTSIDERFWYQYLGQITTGDLTGYKVYQYHLTCIDWLITGESADNDTLQVGEVSDDNGVTWKRAMNITFSGELDVGEQVGWYNFDYSWINNQDQEIYSFSGIPLNWDVNNWKEVQFRNTFVSNDDNIENMGYYLDDFLIYAVENYTVSNRIGFIDVKYPKSSVDGTDVSILYNGSLAYIEVKVKNYGKSQENLLINLTVKNKNGKILDEYSNQIPIGNLNTDGETSAKISWEPENEGDYLLILEVGDYDIDWTPNDNIVQFYVHVRSGVDEKDVDVLVVDDDDSVGQLGIFIKNTEDRILKALDDNEMEYRVFTVEYNETGPTADIMEDYELVIWMTGLDNEVWAHGSRSNYNENNPAWDVTLKEDDEVELESFLNNKDNKLWLISPGYLIDKFGINYKTVPSTDFLRQYLHIKDCTPNVTRYNDNGNIIIRGTPNPLIGVEETIMDNVEYATYENLPPQGFADIGGVIEGDLYDEDAVTIFYQDSAHTQHNAVFYNGEVYKTVTFAFNFYLISGKRDRMDCVSRVLTCFGMTGGPLIELVKPSERLQTVYPNKDISYQLKVTNLGKKPDAIELSVKVTYPKDYPVAYKDWKPRFEENKFVKKSGDNYKVILDGLANTDQVYLVVTAPDTDDYSTYPAANERVRFTANAISTNTRLINSTYVQAEVPVLGNITMTAFRTVAKIKVNEYIDFPLELYNETNGDDGISVELSFSGIGKELTKFVLNGKEIDKKSLLTTLEPNKENDDIELRMSSQQHTLAGFYNITVSLKDKDGIVIYNQLDLILQVEQFYQVECYPVGYDNRKINLSINPNNYTTEFTDYIIKQFPINICNYGNGFDNISLRWEVGPASEDISSWPRPKIQRGSEPGETELSSIEVRYYDENNIDQKCGEDRIFFIVYIPLDADLKTYIIDFIIDSSGPELSNSNEVENNRISFTFKIEKPNLVFTKVDGNNNPNFEFFDSYNLELVDKDTDYGGYYIEMDEKKFDDLELEISVLITNNELTELEFDINNIWLNITHLDENDKIIFDANLSHPFTPTGIVYIEKDEKIKLTFRWDPDTKPSDEGVVYTFKVTLDPNNVIYETNEYDNYDEFQLTIRNIKEKGQPKQDFDIIIISLGIMVLIIFIIVIILLFGKKKLGRKRNLNNE